MAIKTFTTGEVLTAADTNTFLANSGLVYITSASLAGATTAAPVNITGCFSSTYTNYRVVCSDWVNSQAEFLKFQFLVGTTPANAANTYKFQRLAVNGTTVTGEALSLTSGNFPPAGTAGSAFSADIYNPNQTRYTNIVGTGSYDANTGNPVIDLDNNIHNVATAYDGIRLFPAAGTITSATFTIFGYRKA